ncbi:lysozyme [uncultured Pseudacidovorax sp.]|uniref:lysozyme n=1 Tax=uncultured Pseudacidovorax sp. TaxID=679313 RepID=UPI0025D28665|nr:lysozyme [uncultured Pseudacidovorax sp.]
MKISQIGLDAITTFEGVRLEAYPDPATGGEPITIGVGHTGGVKLGDRITREQSDTFLRLDVAHCEKVIERLVLVPLNQGQFDALCSFIFNVGAGNFERSTLLRLLNKRDYDGAADEFLKWNRADGKVLTGLVKRRISERKLFITGTP